MDSSRRDHINSFPIDEQPFISDEDFSLNAAAQSDLQCVSVMQWGDVIILKIFLPDPVGAVSAEVQILQEGDGCVLTKTDSLFHKHILREKA